jgi:hypothetical protein
VTWAADAFGCWPIEPGDLHVLLADGGDHVAGGQPRDATFSGSSQTRIAYSPPPR